MSDTPRTDACGVRALSRPVEYRWQSFEDCARQLERENAQLREALAAAQQDAERLYDTNNRHRHCPDENGGCYFADEPNCSALNPGVAPQPIDYKALYIYLRDHWEDFSGNTWRAPIGPKLDAAICAAIAGRG